MTGGTLALSLSLLTIGAALAGAHQGGQERAVTVEGCLRLEGPQRAGANSSGGRSARSYLMTDAQVVIGAARLSSRVYRVTGIADRELQKRVGERVQVKGVVGDGVIQGTMIDQVTGRDKCVADAAPSSK